MSFLFNFFKFLEIKKSNSFFAKQLSHQPSKSVDELYYQPHQLADQIAPDLSKAESGSFVSFYQKDYKSISGLAHPLLAPRWHISIEHSCESPYDCIMDGSGRPKSTQLNDQDYRKNLQMEILLRSHHPYEELLAN